MLNRHEFPGFPEEPVGTNEAIRLARDDRRDIRWELLYDFFDPRHSNRITVIPKDGKLLPELRDDTYYCEERERVVNNVAIFFNEITAAVLETMKYKPYNPHVILPKDLEGESIYEIHAWDGDFSDLYEHPEVLQFKTEAEVILCFFQKKTQDIHVAMREGAIPHELGEERIAILKDQYNLELNDLIHGLRENLEDKVDLNKLGQFTYRFVFFLDCIEYSGIIIEDDALHAIESFFYTCSKPIHRLQLLYVLNEMRLSRRAQNPKLLGLLSWLIYSIRNNIKEVTVSA